MITDSFWKNKKVFITGHTGFKGSWLCLWLNLLGAEVKGFSLAPPTNPNLFGLCSINKLVRSVIGDIRNSCEIEQEMRSFDPDIVIHMAAQPIVRESYKNPVETYSINIMGTINVFEAVRKCRSVKAVINVTTDKCYENKEWNWGYREIEPLGGYDPYSCSKACSELITSSYRNSFFNPAQYSIHGIGIATARAGNVIGGGDWACDRLIPDCVRAALKREKIIIRYPYAIRPWQHVLEPLNGYLTLAEKLYNNGIENSEAWNFGPNENDAKSVEWIVKKFCTLWGNDISYQVDISEGLHEANYLKLDCSKAKSRLNWHPKWSLEQAICKVVDWTKAYENGQNLRSVCFNQIEEYSEYKNEV